MEQNNFDNNKEELKGIAPHLYSLPKKNAFTAPENYFEKLTVSISDKVHAEKSKTWWQVIFESLTQPKFAVTSIALCMLVGGYMYYQKQSMIIAPVEMTAVNINNLSDDEILSQVDETVLADVIDDNTDDATSAEEVDYLIDNHTDLNSIINEL
jgi:hypothetical protein